MTFLYLATRKLRVRYQLLQCRDLKAIYVFHISLLFYAS